MIGIILAGGKAKRFPHKLLLPQRTIKFKPIIASAIAYASSCCEKTYILVNSIDENFIHKFLKNLNLLNNKIAFLTDNYNGIPAAISIVAKRHPYEMLFILCGDNIYKDQYFNLSKEQTAIRSYDKKRIKQLSIYHSGQYINCTEQEHRVLLTVDLEYYFALTTPWILQAKRFLNKEELQYLKLIEHCLTKWHIPAMIYPSDFWWDIGTFEAYQAYVENRKP